MVFDLDSQYLKYKNLNLNEISSSSDEENNSDHEEELGDSLPMFVIDKKPASEDNTTDPKLLQVTEPEIKIKNKKKPKKDELSSELKLQSSEKSYITVEPEKDPQLVKQNLKQLTIGGKEDELLKKSVFKPGFEKLDAIPPYEETKGQQKRNWKKEKDRTKGPNWFNLPATEMTEERKNDLTILQMRQSLDTKRFYKKNDRTTLPKYFQVGTIIESPADFYHSRVPKKQRKRTIVEELLADAEFQTKSKKKYKEAVKNKPIPFRERREKMKRKRKAQKNKTKT